jgi:hypothetical protein
MSNQGIEPLPQQQQTDAVNHTTEFSAFEPVPEKPAEVQPPAKLSAISFILMVSLDFTRPEIFTDTAMFTDIDTPRGKVDVFHPFKKAKDGQNPGLVREALIHSIGELSKMNDRSVMVLGSPDEVTGKIQSYLGDLVSGIQRSFPLSQDKTVFSAILSDGDESEDLTIPVKMADIVKVSAWVSELHDGASVMNNVVVNVKVQAGKMYNMEEPHKYVNMVQSVLQNCKKDKNVPILLSVSLNPVSLSGATERDLLFTLLENDWQALGRSHLYSIASDNDWVPTTREEIDNLFKDGGDLILINSVN